MNKKIGFIGIGLMGLPMAKNILKAGYNLKAFNRSQSKAEPLKDFGAEISSTINDVVKESDVLITMLTDDTAIDDVMNSSNFLDNLKSGTTVIDMSSVKPTTAVVGLTELISITVVPDFKLSKKLELFITSSIAVSSVSIVIKTSLSFTTSLIVDEISAPKSFNGSALLCDLLNAFKL